MKTFGLLLLLQLGWLSVLAQLSISGTVTGVSGEPLPGASIVVVDSYTGTSSDARGRFLLRNLKPGNYTLMVTFIGYKKQLTEVNLAGNLDLPVVLSPEVVFTEEVLVQATRAGSKTPVAVANIGRDEIARRNMGTDIPYLLALTPSLVATSDAGNGIGYSSFRVRGTDMNRINVSVNGIPLNDAESHGTWFVDLPDLASSLANVQIQRGVGTSVNGAAAFGATINLQTIAFQPEPMAEFHSAGGSFNTFKNTLSASSGLINGKFTIDTRLSKINSDGFIDRAFSDLKSFYVATGYYSANTMLKAVVMSGLQESYQAWNGVPSVRLNSDLQGMKRYEDHWLYSAGETVKMIAANPRTYNLYDYENQVDNYQQDHFQLHLSHRIGNELNISGALHRTLGEGYYEQFKANDKFSKYGLADPVFNGEKITRTDLVRRKWLQNDFYGAIFSLNYRAGRSELSWGGGANHYSGGHFGKIVQAKLLGNNPLNHEWYRNRGEKTDVNSYLRLQYQLSHLVTLYGDLQYRGIDYRLDGIDDDLRSIDQQHRFHFFNPKAGIFFQPDDNRQGYFSWSRANREPNRDNFVDAAPGQPVPRHETLNDLELGYLIRGTAYTAGINFYHMYYRNQLVLTGQINDVGAPVMVNVERSHRTGIELTWGVRLLPAIRWDANATLSRNTIKDFTEYVDDWDTGGQQVNNLGKTDIAFSPSTVLNSMVTWEPFEMLSIGLTSQYVGEQFIDNTASDDRKLDAWLVNSIKADFTLRGRYFREVTFHAMINNLFDHQYESNAWVYSYFYEGNRYKMDGYFPQAGRNFMAGVSVRF